MLYIQFINQSSDIFAPILNIKRSTINQSKNNDILNFIKHIAIDNININISNILEIKISKNDKSLKPCSVM